MEELYNESLFNEWIEVLFSISEDLNEPDAAKVIWKYAKNQAIGILCSKYPENEYKRRCISIKKDITESEVIDNIYIGFRFEQEVISTINDILLSMMLYSADDNTIKHIWNNYVEFPKHKYYNLIEYILKKLFSGTLIKNYN